MKTNLRSISITVAAWSLPALFDAKQMYTPLFSGRAFKILKTLPVCFTFDPNSAWFCETSKKLKKKPSKSIKSNSPSTTQSSDKAIRNFRKSTRNLLLEWQCICVQVPQSSAAVHSISLRCWRQRTMIDCFHLGIEHCKRICQSRRRSSIWSWVLRRKQRHCVGVRRRLPWSTRHGRVGTMCTWGRSLLQVRLSIGSAWLRLLPVAVLGRLVVASVPHERKLESFGRCRRCCFQRGIGSCLRQIYATSWISSSHHGWRHLVTFHRRVCPIGFVVEESQMLRKAVQRQCFLPGWQLLVKSELLGLTMTQCLIKI